MLKTICRPFKAANRFEKSRDNLKRKARKNKQSDEKFDI